MFSVYINVEWCNKLKVIKYLFKYINKGLDRIIIIIKDNNFKLGNGYVEILEEDEIKIYLGYNRYFFVC